MLITFIYNYCWVSCFSCFSCFSAKSNLYKSLLNLVTHISSGSYPLDPPKMYTDSPTRVAVWKPRAVGAVPTKIIIK